MKLSLILIKEEYNGKVVIGKAKYLLKYCILLYLDVQFISFPTNWESIVLIGKIRSFKLRVFSSNLSALVLSI
jgi:hypothetical protein